MLFTATLSPDQPTVLGTYVLQPYSSATGTQEAEMMCAPRGPRFGGAQSVGYDTESPLTLQQLAKIAGLLNAAQKVVHDLDGCKKNGVLLPGGLETSIDLLLRLALDKFWVQT